MKQKLYFFILVALSATPALAGKWDSLWGDIKSEYRYTLQVPANMTVEASSARGAAVSFNVTAKDGYGKAADAACSPASGSQFALGSTEVFCVTEGSAALRVRARFSVTVVDTRRPVLTLPGNINLTSPDGSAVATGFFASARDVVSGSVAVQCTPAPGSSFSVGNHTVNCSATDTAGNTARGSFAVAIAPKEVVVVPDPVVPDPVEEERTVTLSWIAPVSREDGSPLTVADISRYEIYVIGEFTGTDQRIIVDNGRALQHTVENLQNDTYHFFISAMDNNGLLSEPSDVVTLTL